MADASITKVTSIDSPAGQMGQKYLAAGVHMGMRLWEQKPPTNEMPYTRRDYETVGYVIDGWAELEIEGQKISLKQGDSWVVPKGALHRYVIVKTLTAVEATCPPAFVHGRDDPPAESNGLGDAPNIDLS